MNSVSIRKNLAAAALAFGFTIVQASFVNVAQGAEEPAAVAVRYGDLDLTATGDVALLYQRINAAAAAVCRVNPLTGSKLPGNERTRCVAASVALAVTDVNSIMLSAYHLQETAAAKDARRRGA